MKRKALALVITVCLVLAMIPMSGFAETAAEKVNLVDANHWAAAQIEKWASVGLILGDERGFRPDDPITRAEMAAILSNLMGYQVKADNTFVDVKDTAWYADAVLKANASGVLSGDGKGHAFPEKHITREEAASMFARAFSVDSSTGKETSFKDSGDISAWARPSVFGMEAYKYIGGKGNGVFAPKANITRAEVVTIVNNAVRAYYTEAGTYTANVEPLTRGGNCVTIVKAADVVIKDALIAGDLIVAEGVGDGDFTLDNTRIEGKMIARGGGDDSIIITGDSSVQNLRIERIDGQVRVFADDGTEVGTVIADGKDDVIIEGAFTEVMVLADDITVTANNANIRSATITGANSNIIIGRYSSVSTITVSGNGTSISGPGRVGTVYANADDISVMTPDTTVTAGLGTQGVTAGDTNVAPGTSQNTSGSRTGRGGNTPPDNRSYQIVNGDFETGDFTGWTVVSDDSKPIICHADNDFISYYADMGDGTGAIDSVVSISQSVTVKNNAGTPYLVFSYYIDGYPPEDATGLEIYINDSPEPIEYLWEGSIYGDWELHCIDLSLYKGQTIEITFNSLISECVDGANCGIDNISIEYEPTAGNSGSNAILLATDGTSQTHWILPEDDADWFKFNAAEGEIFVITTSDLYPPYMYDDDVDLMDTYMYLYSDVNGSDLIAENDDDYINYNSLGSRIVFSCSTSGTYYIKVVHYDHTGGEPERYSIGRYDIAINKVDDILVNGDFETGDFSGWKVKTAGIFPVVQDDVIHGGRYAAHMGDGAEGMAEAGEYYTAISQYVFIEENDTVPLLYISYYLDNGDMEEGDSYDGMDILVNGVRAAEIESVETDGWQQLRVDLFEFAGEIVNLSVVCWTEDDEFEVNYYIDDIILTYEDRSLGEPGNDTTEGATLLIPDSAQTHWIYPYDDIDYFCFEVEQGVLYSIETFDLYPDIPVAPDDFYPEEDFEEYHHMVTGLFIVDREGNEIIGVSDGCYSDYNYADNGINRSVVNFTPDKNETYFAKVIHPLGYISDLEEAVGRYDILLTEKADVGDDYTSAALLTVNAGFETYSINSETDTDWYKFEAEAGMTYRIGTDMSNDANINSDIILTLYKLDSEGISELAEGSLTETIGKGSDVNELKYVFEEKGTYYIEVASDDSEPVTGLYNIGVYEDTAGDKEDFSDALSITVNGEPQTHYINPYFDIDMFTFVAEAGKKYTIKATNLMPNNMETVVALINGADLYDESYSRQNAEFGLNESVIVHDSSIDEKLYIAVMNPLGLIGGYKTATGKYDISVTATTIEVVAVTGISLDHGSLNLTAGTSGALTPTISPPDATNTGIVWTSSDTGVATVNNGVVTAVSEGTATITATTVDGGHVAYCTVTVINREQEAPAGLTGVAPTAALDDGKIMGTTEEMEYKLSTNTEWTQAGEGETTALSAGTYHVRYKAKPGFNAGSPTEVTIPPYIAPEVPEVLSVTVTPESATIIQGHTLQLLASVDAIAGASEAVEWSSSDTAGKVTVDNTGLVRVAADAALREYTITAKSTFDVTKSDTSVITVTAPKPVTGITLNYNVLTLVTGNGPQVIIATIEPADATNQNIIWSSSDENVATVNDGTVTPLAAGTTTIRAATEDGGLTDTCEVTVLETVDIADILGLQQPIKGETPVATIIENAQYSGTISWNPGNNPFEAGVSYTATITLTAKDGYTFTGVEENFFTVEGATSVTNDADTGIVTAVFPIAVTDADDLDQIRNDLSADYIQMVNITLEGWDWTPIGDDENKFTGSYNGNDFTISNITIDREFYYYVGLFAYAESADLLNITLRNVDVTGNLDVGGLIGYGKNCNIVNCIVESGNVTGIDINIGGLAGRIENSTIMNCFSGCGIRGVQHVGGLIGQLYSDNNVINCYATGDVTGTGYLGKDGLTGWYTGGLVGLAQGVGESIIQRSFATGNVTGVSGVGGLVGQVHTIIDCYALGNVTGSGDGIGGLAGYNGGPIENCYSVGLVTAPDSSQYYGGMLGHYNSTYDIVSSYYDEETAGMTDTDKGTPKTTAEMKQPETFVGWDFDDIWDIDEGESYPYLKWQNNDEK